MSKMMHDQPSAAVPASRDRRNFLIAGAGLALAATTLGRSSAVMAKHVCDRVLHWYEGNQHAPLNGVMSFFHK